MAARLVSMRAASLAVLGAAGVLLAGCGGSDATKAGGSAAPITLRMGTQQSPGRPEADQIEEFARQVDELSAGRIRIEAVFGAVDGTADDWDQRVARMVVRGDLDLAIVEARAWDTEGVTSLNALDAPFLVTSDELLERILTSELATELLSGLDRAGVVGLALVPMGLRHPFAFGDPLISLDDYTGAVIRTPRSDVAYSVFEAFGARPDDLTGPAFDEAIADGSVAAADSSFALASSLGAPTVATGNVTFFPRVSTLVVDADVLAALDEEQRAILEQAAAQTLQWALEVTPTDREAAQAWCEQGCATVLASEADVAALERATAPVYADLERDPQTKLLIEAIQTLKSELPASAETTPPACEAPGGVTAATTEASVQSFPNGVYRAEHTVEELLQAGMDPAEVDGYAGIHTIAFADGTYTDQSAGGTYRFPLCLGEYTSSGSRIEIDFQVDCTGGMTATWTIEDGALRFTDIEGKVAGETQIVRAVFGSEPFLKLDDD